MTILGPVLAVIYALVISSILWWMLHIPEAGSIEQHVNRMVREAEGFARIVVPVQGDVVSDRLVALASQMAKFRGAHMDLLYVIEVPLQLPITASMTNEEAAARVVLKKAAKIAARYDVTINAQIERARQAGPAIVRYVQQAGADVCLMGDTPNRNKRGTRFARTVEYVFENAPCEVILDRPATDT